MRFAVLTTLVALAACDPSEPELVSDLDIGRGDIAATADAVFVTSVPRALYEVPVDGSEPRVLDGVASPQAGCGLDERIWVDGTEVFWMQSSGLLHRVDRITGDKGLADTACSFDATSADGIAYWVVDSALWAWPRGGEPAQVSATAPESLFEVVDGWWYAFQDTGLVRSRIDGSSREVLYPSGVVYEQVPLTIADGFVYFGEVVDYGSLDRIVRVPVDGGDAEILGTMASSGGDLLVDDAGVYRDAYRLLPGADTAEQFLPTGGPSRTGVGAVAISGDHVYWVLVDQSPGRRLYRIDKTGEAKSSAGSDDLVTPPFL